MELLFLQSLRVIHVLGTCSSASLSEGFSLIMVVGIAIKVHLWEIRSIQSISVACKLRILTEIVGFVTIRCRRRDLMIWFMPISNNWLQKTSIIWNSQEKKYSKIVQELFNYVFSSANQWSLNFRTENKFLNWCLPGGSSKNIKQKFWMSVWKSSPIPSLLSPHIYVT